MTPPIGSARSGLISLHGAEYAPPQSVQNNLDYWYPILEGSGTTLSESLADFNATLNGPVWASGGYENKSVDCDGVDDYWVSDGTVSVTSAISICGWFNIDNVDGFDPIFLVSTNSTDPNNNASAWLEVRPDFRLFATDTNTNSSSVGLSDGGGVTTGKQYFFAASVDSSTGDAWLYDTNGQLDSASGALSDSTGGTNYELAGARGRDWFDGTQSAAGFAINNKLTATDVQAIYDDTVGDIA